MLGGFIQGVAVEGGQFVGGPLDWLTPFSLLVAAGLVAGYALLGAAWLVFKTQGDLFERARRWVTQLALLTAMAMGAVSLGTQKIPAPFGYLADVSDMKEEKMEKLKSKAVDRLASLLGPYGEVVKKAQEWKAACGGA